MNYSPIVKYNTILVDEEVCAYLNLHWNKRNGGLSPTIQAILKAGEFAKAVKERYPSLINEDYFTIEFSANEELEDVGKIFYTHHFTGTVHPKPNGKCEENEFGMVLIPVDFHSEYEDEFLAIINPDKAADHFKLAYNSVEEFLDEIRKFMHDFYEFPMDFDWGSKMVILSGVYDDRDDYGDYCGSDEDEDF